MIPDYGDNSPVKRFSHCSGVFEFDRDREYLEVDNGFKPDGLWLSDDSNNNGWIAWCKEQNNGWIRGHNIWEVLVDTRRLLKISRSPENVPKKYLIPHPGFRPGSKQLCVDWKQLKADGYAGFWVDDYKGVFVDHIWWYGWDCDSAVVWDLSVVVQVEPMVASKVALRHD